MNIDEVFKLMQKLGRKTLSLPRGQTGSRIFALKTRRYELMFVKGGKEVKKRGWVLGEKAEEDEGFTKPGFWGKIGAW